LRWTPELHEYFVQTVQSLGGKHSKFFFPLFWLCYVIGLTRIWDLFLFSYLLSCISNCVPF
jgi:hypothetical protein